MKRAALERARAIRTWKKHAQWNHPVGSTCPCDLQINRFRKGQRWAGCSKGRRCICKLEKVWGFPKPRDLRQEARHEDEA